MTCVRALRPINSQPGRGEGHRPIPLRLQLLRHLNGGPSMARGQMIRCAPARLRRANNGVGPLRSFPKDFNHPPALLGQGTP
jgi:hypothetical protein